MQLFTYLQSHLFDFQMNNWLYTFLNNECYCFLFHTVYNSRFLCTKVSIIFLLHTLTTFFFEMLCPSKSHSKPQTINHTAHIHSPISWFWDINTFLVGLHSGTETNWSVKPLVGKYNYMTFSKSALGIKKCT